MTDAPAAGHTPGPIYLHCLTALQAARDACFRHEDRDVLGMSHGPFSGCNEVLGIVSRMECERADLLKRLEEAEAVMTIVAPRSHTAEYLKTIENIRAVIASARAPSSKGERM